ncbi:hypothetical protein AVEN_121136-1 [Araneus ventricosus]|uniref:Uncharacterized protein n=1 Tax=Araneus ventricosus TaxID=182803 RepID=A0A4Y2E356_ARAVE|nr:hypothetical protein AVEN_121136-1 [Araneus ventricosus]
MKSKMNKEVELLASSDNRLISIWICLGVMAVYFELIEPHLRLLLTNDVTVTSVGYLSLNPRCHHNPCHYYKSFSSDKSTISEQQKTSVDTTALYELK